MRFGQAAASQDEAEESDATEEEAGLRSHGSQGGFEGFKKVPTRKTLGTTQIA